MLFTTSDAWLKLFWLSRSSRCSTPRLVAFWVLVTNKPVSTLLMSSNASVMSSIGGVSRMTKS